MLLRLAPRWPAPASPAPVVPAFGLGPRVGLACLLLAVGTWASWRTLLRSRIWDYLTDADYLGAGVVFFVFLLAAVAVCWGTPERLVWLADKLRQDIPPDIPPDAGDAVPAPALIVVASSRAHARPTARWPRPRTRRRDQDWDDRWPR